MTHRRSSHLTTTPTSGKSIPTTPSANLLNQCNKCESLLSPKDKIRHNDRACSAVRSSSHTEVGHGFIREDRLYAELVRIRDKDLKDTPESERPDVLLMNEIGMDHMRLNAGDPVRVQSSDGQRVFSCTVFPHMSLKNPCHVSFTDDNISCEDGDVFIIEKITEHDVAKIIIVETACANPAAVTGTGIDALIKIRKQLIDRYVFHGMTVKLDEDEEYRLSMHKPDIADRLSQLTVTTNGHSTNAHTSHSWPKFYHVTKQTRITFPVRSRVTFSDVAGLDHEIGLLHKHLVLPIEKQHLSRDTKYRTAKSVLIHGFTGTGKTLTINAFVNEYWDRINCVYIDAASILSKSADSTERKLNSIIDFAIDQNPCILFFDRMDVLFSGKKSQTDQDKKLIASMLMHFDRVNETDGVFLVGITNQIDCIDNVLRGPGKFQLEIEFPIPMAKHRKSIFRKLLSAGKHTVTTDSMDSMAEKAFSFTGADLKAVVDAAFTDAIGLDREAISELDLEKGFLSVKPSAMKEILLEVPSVKWNEIGGVSLIRSKLEQMVIWPFKYPEYFIRMGISPRKGILMYGPPGCSKTMIGKALATESNLNFISIKGPELFNKYVGESERAVRQIFRKAKQASPSILFFDEIDALAPERSSSSSSSSSSSNNSVSDRVLAQLLTEMDGIESLTQVVIVAATNRPDKIDPALLRPGRLDSLIYVPLPDCNARREIFRIRTKNMPLQEDIDVEELVSKTNGYSGAEVTAICTEAGLSAMAEFLANDPPDDRDDGEKVSCRHVDHMRVTMNHFVTAASSIKAHTSREMVQSFEKYQESN